MRGLANSAAYAGVIAVMLVFAGCAVPLRVLFINQSGEQVTVRLLDRRAEPYREHRPRLRDGDARQFSHGEILPEGVLRLSTVRCDYTYKAPDPPWGQGPASDWLIRARLGSDFVVRVLMPSEDARRLADEPGGYERHGVALGPSSKTCH